MFTISILKGKFLFEQPKELKVYHLADKWYVYTTNKSENIINLIEKDKQITLGNNFQFPL
jgi:hypothetical protein